MFTEAAGHELRDSTVTARLAVAPSIFDKMVLAVDDAGNFSRFSRLGIAYELPGFVHGGNFEHEKNVLRFPDGTPDTKQSKAGLLVGGSVRSEHGLPAQEVHNPITA
jgi:hypothetical protein